MEFQPEKVFFKSDTNDPFTKLPIYVFDSTYLPNLVNTGLDKKASDAIIVKCFKRIIPRIPKHAYSVACFTSGFKNVSNHTNSWVTMLKCYQLLPELLRSNLKKIFIVHESWLIRSFTQIMSNVFPSKLFKTSSVNGGSYDKLIYCKNLTELSKHCDITKIRISLDVYMFDLQYHERLIIPYSAKHHSHDYQEYRKLIFTKVIQRLTTEGIEVDLVMTKPGKQQKLAILTDAIDRMNYLDLSQWDIYCMGSLFLHLIRTLHKRLIPVDQIPLPIHDDYQYTFNTFTNLAKGNDSFETLARVLDISLIMISNETTSHDLKSITKTLIPALAQEKVSLKTSDRLSIGSRFLKNLLLNWEQIQRDMFPASNPKAVPKAPASRKVSTLAEPVVIRTQEEAKEMPKVPRRNASASSTVPTDTSDTSSSPVQGRQPQEEFDSKAELGLTSSLLSSPTTLLHKAKTQDGADGLKALSDVTSSLNKQQVPIRKEIKPVMTKFSDSYSSLEGQKKVNKLAKLYEERLKGIEILDQLEKKN